MRIQPFSQAYALATLGPGIALHHEISLHVRPILLLPGVTLIAEFIHLAWIDGAVLLPARETNNSQTTKRKRTNAVLKFGNILLHGNGGDELEFNLLILGRYRFDHGELPSIGSTIGVVGQYRFTSVSIIDVSINAYLFEILNKGKKDA